LKAQVKRSENSQFVVKNDDQRLLVNVVDTDPLSAPFTLITNGTARLKK
jgi:hypothetical protein